MVLDMTSFASQHGARNCSALHPSTQGQFHGVGHLAVHDGPYQIALSNLHPEGGSILQHGRKESNHQPPDLESGALPIELHPYPGFQRTDSIAGRISRLLLTRFFVNRVLTESRAILLQFQPLGTTSFFRCPIVSVTSLGTFEPDILTGHDATPMHFNDRAEPQPNLMEPTKTRDPLDLRAERDAIYSVNPT